MGKRQSCQYEVLAGAAMRLSRELITGIQLVIQRTMFDRQSRTGGEACDAAWWRGQSGLVHLKNEAEA